MVVLVMEEVVVVSVVTEVVVVDIPWLRPPFPQPQTLRLSIGQQCTRVHHFEGNWFYRQNHPT